MTGQYFQYFQGLKEAIVKKKKEIKHLKEGGSRLVKAVPCSF